MADARTFDYIGLELSGSGYSKELRESMTDILTRTGLGSVVSRGQIAPACGPDLQADIIAVITESVMSATISWAIEKLLDTVRSFLKKADNGSIELKVTIRRPEYDLVVIDRYAGDENDVRDNVKHFTISEDLLTAMDTFVGLENQKKCLVNSICLPCSIEQGTDTQLCILGVGNPKLWVVEYAEGIRWPMAVYDSVNESFLRNVMVQHLG